MEKYPLVVVIKNGLKVAPSAERPFIEVKPPSRRDLGIPFDVSRARSHGDRAHEA